MKKSTMTVEKMCYMVLLYPPMGVPRVVELPDVGAPMIAKTFSTPEEAETALEEFLVKNPEYRRWKDGSIK